MKYFKHDSNAMLDAKLKRVRMKWGMEGYGVYWYLLECIARNVESHNLTFVLEEDAELIAADTGINYERIQDMMRDFVDFRLFENVEGVISCLSMAKRTDEYTQKLLRTMSGVTPDKLRIKSGHTPEKVPPNRIEENRKDISRGRFTPPTLAQVTDYCQERSNSVDPQKFIDHYEANGWMRGKNKVKDWKACVRTWERNTEAGTRDNRYL